MSATLGNTTINGKASQTGNGTDANDLLRKAQIDALLAAISTHAAATGANTTTISITLSGQQISGVVKLDADSDLAVGTAGLRVANNTFSRANHTHGNATTSLAGFMSAADKQKLDGISTGATSTSADAYLLARENHTGNQGAATISDFAAAVGAIALPLTGGAVTGNLSFSGNGSFELPKFSAAEIANLTWSQASLIYNETANTSQIYLGSAWHPIQIGNGSGGGVNFDDVSGAISIAANGTSTLGNATIGVQHFTAWQPGDFLVGPVSVAGAPRIVQPSVVRGLLNVADGATANANNTYLLSRENHTGTQPASSIANFSAEVQAVALTNPMTSLGDLVVGNASGIPVRLPVGGNDTSLCVVGGNLAWASRMPNPITTSGDLVVGGAAGVPARLAKGANGTGLVVVGGNLAWAALYANPMTTFGDIVVGGANGTAGRLPIGANGTRLAVVGGNLAWANETAGFTNPMTTSGDIIVAGGNGTPSRLAKGPNRAVLEISNGNLAWGRRDVVPDGSVLISDGDYNATRTSHNGKLVVLDSTTATAILTMTTDSTGGWADGDNLWVMADAIVNTCSVSMEGGAALWRNGSNGGFTPVLGVVYHIWRAGADTWRVISQS